MSDDVTVTHSKQFVDGLLDMLETRTTERDEARAELDALRDGLRTLLTYCDCGMPSGGDGHDYACNARSETVYKDDLWALLDGDR